MRWLAAFVGGAPDVESVSSSNTQPRDTVPAVEPVKKPQILLSEAKQYLHEGKIDLAGKAIRTAVAMEPENPRLTFTLAIVLVAEHRFPDLVMMLDELATKAPETHLPSLGQTAEWMVLQGDWRRAEERYKAVLAEVPDAAMAHRQLAQLLVRQGRRREASSHLNALCRQGNIEEFELRTLLNLTSPFAGDIGRAELEPIGWMGKARALIGDGKWENAASTLLSAKTMTPAESALLGRIWAHQNDFSELETWARKKPTVAPEPHDASFARAVYEAQKGNHRLALTHFCEAVLGDPTDMRAYEELAKSLTQLGESDQAAQAMERARLLARSREIGNEMASNDQRDLNRIAELAEILEKLHRPFEALSWQAVRMIYGATTFPKDQQQTQLIEINRRRLQLLEKPQKAATKEFIICGINLETLPLQNAPPEQEVP